MGATAFAFSYRASIALFQSSPIPKDGRYIKAKLVPPRVLIVSILAHPKGWALPAQPAHGAAHSLVSILAHPKGWALQYPVNPLIYRKFTV